MPLDNAQSHVRFDESWLDGIMPFVSTKLREDALGDSTTVGDRKSVV